MSLHIMYTHRCKNCESRYIPYQKNLKCPKCGIKEDEECSVVEDIVKSALFQKISYGKYTPIAWWLGSFADQIAFYIFKMLDYFSKQDNNNFANFARNYVNEMEWEEVYLKEHIYEIACLVHEELEKNLLVAKQGE